MDIRIKTIEHKDQRYSTVGDWQVINGVLEIRVSKMQNHREELLIASHELHEALLCIERDITDKQVDDFDFKWKGEGEPGDCVDAPYFKEHRFSEIIERLLAIELDVNWQDYCKACENVS